MDIFIEILKEMRLSRGMSQEKLAKETGLSQSAIAFWEKGQRVPNALAVITLARYFGVSSDWLLGLED